MNITILRKALQILKKFRRRINMIYNNRYFMYTVWTLIIVSIIFILAQLNYFINSIRTLLMITLLPTLISSLFYYLLRPLIKYLVKKKINKTFAVIGVLSVVIAFLIILSIFAGRAISEEFSNFYKTFSKYFQEIQKSTENLTGQDNFLGFSFKDIESNILSTWQIVFQMLRENMSDWVTNISDLGTVIILIPIVVFFLLKDDEFFYNSMIQVVPKKLKNRVVEIIREIDSVLQNYFIGQLIVAGFLGLLTYIGFLIIGLPNALFLAAFSMIFSIIPFLGPFIGILPAIFIGWTVNPLMIVKVLIVLIITQQLEGGVVRPKIMGSRLEIHPMVIIFLVIMAVTLYGFIGAFFVVPLYAMLRIIVRHSLQNYQGQMNHFDEKK